jgi:ketosteroid isomerase-like protein
MSTLDIVKKAYAAWDAKDIEALRTILHPEYKAKMPGGMEIVGLEGAKACLDACPFQDPRSENETYIVEGDRVVRIWDMVADKPVQVRSRMAELSVVKDGKIFFNEAFFDLSGFPKELCDQAKEKLEKQPATTGSAKK